jgi:dihydrodipicolinate synthase/N-acetylneuraminate lyase
MNGGIYTPLVTPLLGQDALDVGGLERVLEHVIGGGVHGIFLLGTTGEGPLLSIRLRIETLRRAAALVAGRLPLLVNVTGCVFVENLELARAAVEVGAQAAVYSGPLYAPLSQDALAAHVERFATQCPLPLFLYNMPSHTHLTFELATVVRLAETAQVVGLKDSSGDLLYVQQVVRSLGTEFPVFVGPEELLYPALLYGAAGGVNGGSNLCPQIFTGIFDAVRRGDHAEAARLQQISQDLSEAVYSGGYLRGLKAAMAARGLCGPILAEPDAPLGAEAAGRIALALQRPEFDSTVRA